MNTATGETSIIISEGSSPPLSISSILSLLPAFSSSLIDLFQWITFPSFLPIQTLIPTTSLRSVKDSEGSPFTLSTSLYPSTPFLFDDATSISTLGFNW
ncbi:hypothetical protein HMI54_009886 [Coelomomyces lativittatus]|nr:hypothetical protein HMI54_009886 [Coelomomyces lativittatus]